MKYKKILIKFSGEAFGNKGQGVDLKKVQQIVDEIKVLKKKGINVGIVCGGGNVIRGREVKKSARLMTHYKGMQATLINVKPLEKLFKKEKISTSVFASFSLKSNYPVFNQLKVNKDWKAGKVIIFAGGTGHPFFTTDTGAVLRALQLEADLFIKATKVDGIYDSDPQKNKKAKKIEKINYRKYIESDLQILDSMAICMAWNNNLPIRVLKWEEGSIIKLLNNKNIGSLIN